MTRSMLRRVLLGLLGALAAVVFGLAAGSAHVLAAPSQPLDLPSGLCAADWAEIRGQIEVQQPHDLSEVYAPPLAPEQPYLKASNTDAGDFFGYSVDIFGDTVVVGAHSEASSATGISGDQSDNKAPVSGAVYVFVRSGGVWTQEAYLKASNAEAGDYFGYSVAIFGDTLVVGAMHEDGSATGVDGDQSSNGALKSGAAYVFTRNEGIWKQEAYLKASNTDAADRFGADVAIYDGTVVVSAYTEAGGATGVDGDQSDNSAPNSGAAYVFARSGGAWKQEAYLKASNTGAEDRFGTSVAISGDTVVVGAIGEDSSATGVNGNQSDNSASSSGAVYVFVQSGGGWTQEAYLKASNTGTYGYFGHSVAISDDTVVVGSDGEDSNATGVNGNQSDNSASGAGAAYVFTRSSGSWTQEAYLKASNTGVQDWFGYSVAISGDTVVVGALSEASSATGVNGNQSDNAADRAGAAYLFSRNGGTWMQGAYLKASNTGAVDRFCQSVAIDRDTVVMGAREEDSSATGVDGNQSDNSATDSGAAYVLVLPSPPTIININPPSGPAAGGTSVIITGTDFIGLGGPALDPDAVTFGGVNATTYTVNSFTQITATAPAHAAGTVDVQVAALGGPSANTTADDFNYYNTYTLTYTAGAGGTITGTTPQTVAHGGSGTAVTAAPNAGYHFVKWSDEVATATRTDTNVTGSISVSAAFAADTYPLTYTSYRGLDRYDTAIRLSRAANPAPLPAGSGLVLAPGETFQEALCGAPLASAYGGPVLLNPKTALRQDVMTEVRRLAPQSVFVIGYSTTIVSRIRAALPGITVTPINGTSVYDMSYRVAKALGAKVGDLSAATAVITIGTNFPDALGVAPLTCAKLWPILLTEPITRLIPDPPLNPKAVQALSELGITQAIRVGTYVTMPAGVVSRANLSGANRYFTNVKVANWAKANAGPTFTHTAIATGDKFPDALAAGPYLAKDGGILLLSPLLGPVPTPIGEVIAANKADVQHVTFIACVEPVIGQVKALLGSTVNLIFIHHSVGQNWLNNGLTAALNASQYHVADTTYGWTGGGGVDYGSSTDTGDWPGWFNNTVMPLVYAEMDTMTTTNTVAAAPGGNTVIMFKSCYPNSDVGSDISDEKATYNSLLPYFQAHPDKMFVLITPPPMQSISYPLKTRELCNWLTNRDTGWLKDLTTGNVFVFDFYNVLTSPNAHHRVVGGVEVHDVVTGANTLYYDSSGDDHPNAAGSSKAAQEFVPLLNKWYQEFKASR